MFQYEWTIPPSLCAAQQVSCCLRAGTKFEGNVTHINKLLKALWDAYKVERGLTLTRQGRQPKLETVALLQLGPGSPGMRPVQKVKAAAISQVARCSVRVVVPSH